MSKFDVFCDKYISQFTHQLGELKSVGLEKEILATDYKGVMVNITDKIWPHLIKHGLKPYYDSYYKDSILGFWVDEDQIALDAGKGTFEIIMKPYDSVQEAERKMKKLLQIVLPICEEEKIKLLSVGYQPRTLPSRDNWNRKQRYEVLLNLFKESVYPASLSASDQVHVDVAPEELVTVINVMNGFAPFFVALFANCPVFEGANNFKAYRETIWDDLGHDRTGLPFTAIDSIEDYLERTWEMECIMALDGDKFYSPRMKFKDFSKDFNDDELFEAYNVHEGTVWFCARPRVYGTVEVRPAGLQPWEDMVCVSALSLGLMENLQESEMFLKEFRWDMLRELRLQVVKKGFDVDFKGKPIANFVEEILNIAKRGLLKRGKKEEVYLESLFDRVKNRKAPVDISREYLKEGGFTYFLDKVSLKKEHLNI